ncbi:MAG: MBL fold metallo-hydrolase [Acidobacteria bacterium]|nr:MBL fold metallo-hydrolase [Acidobacteriota bacterium]
MRTSLAILFALCLALPATAANTLNFYFIDVEGGQATLMVTPAGQSVLVDAGWPGFNGRDAGRIAAAVKHAGLKKIDFLLVTHYHTDHVGGVPQLLAKVPVTTVIDHGTNTETGKGADALWKAYEEAIAKHKRMVIKRGDALPFKGLEAKVVAARGDLIEEALPGAGQENPLCAAERRRDEDKSENARSIGFVLQWGKFRFIDLADLTWNKELDLSCPNHKIGKIDVYLVTHHGMNMSGPSAMVHALKPRVAIMNNGAKKGGSAETFEIVKRSPGLEDLWQLHFALAAGQERNSPDSLIANVDPVCEGKWLKMTVASNGSFTVENSRNGFKKTYK